MKYIYELIPDIQALLKTKGWFTEDLSKEFTYAITSRLSAQFQQDTSKRALRLSQMGPRCPKALWHSIHTPEQAESLPAWAEFKFSYGHVIEALALSLAKAAGHEVLGEQDALELDGVEGHRDAVIDGCLVDVKSCSSRVYDKFKNKTIEQDDSFGYLDQLDGYLAACAKDPLVRVKDKAYILAVDKTLGHMILYEHNLRANSIRQRIAEYKDVVKSSVPPACECGTVKHGASGNVALDTRASYSAYKHSCFPNLRTFIYSGGPVYLTNVNRLPDVPELRR